MAEFNIRTDAVDVEQIMRQIRARIQEKRGVDYTEQQIQELANVKLERFLDPKGIRSDLVEQFRRERARKLEPFHLHPEPSHGFDAEMLYGTHRGVLRLLRRLFNPILKLFFNPNVVIHALHKQTEINSLYEAQFHFLREKIQQRDELDVLYYELVHNLVLELTRVGIENRNLKMRLESLSSRLDFDERRARALEGVVQYRPGTGPSREPQPVKAPAAAIPQEEGRPVQPSTSPSGEVADSTTARRRRRRRRGRRGGRGRSPEIQPGSATEIASAEDSATPPHGDPAGEAAANSSLADNPFDAGAPKGAHYDEDDEPESGEDEGPDTSTQ